MTCAVSVATGLQLCFLPQLNWKHSRLNPVLNVFGIFASLWQDVQEKRIWTVEMTMHEFEAIPELKALTTTPFMIQIVVQILPILKEMRATVSLSIMLDGHFESMFHFDTDTPSVPSSVP